MIAIREIATGEVQVVAGDALPDGYDPACWEVLDALPVDPDPAWDVLRARRDLLLFASDPTQLADKEPAYRADWQAWRDLLLDLPEVTLDPAAPDWPTPPDSAELDKLLRAFLAARSATPPTL